MIRCEELAEAIVFEANLLAQKHSSKKELLERAPLPPLKEMVEVLNVLWKASLLFEEGRPCCPRLIYMGQDGSSGKASSNAHTFKDPLIFNSEILRKISPALGEVDYLSWSLQGGLPLITGIHVHRVSESPQLFFTVPKPGSIDVIWQFSRIVSFRDGELRQLSQCGLADTAGLCSMLSRAFGTFETHFLGSIVRRVSKQKHGGAIWILNDSAQPQGIEMSYEINNEGKEKMGTLMDRFDNHVAREDWLNSLAYLAAVDGAVLMNSRLQVLGFGSFIKTDEAIKLERYKNDGTHETILSTDLGGGRHRSAVTFCHTHTPSAAIVASADGRMTFLANLNEGTMPICLEMNSMGFLDKFL